MRHERAAALVASAFLVWLAQFHHAASFGLYEDDYFFISRAMGQDVSYLVTRLSVFWTLPQGRPFGFFLPDLLSFIGDKLGGLDAIYVLGSLVVVLNTFLCYALLRTRVPPAAAGCGAAMFCLFPADTTKILLTHDFQLQPALTFALLAGLAYAAGRLRPAYVLSAGALLSYESGFLALIALPLLVRRWHRPVWRELMRHALILAGIVFLVVLARFVVGEVRATQSVGGASEVLPRLTGSLVLGPLRSVAATLYQPFRVVPGWDAETLALALLALGVFALGMWRMRPAVAARWRDVLEVGGAGVAMLMLGYGLAFTAGYGGHSRCRCSGFAQRAPKVRRRASGRVFRPCGRLLRHDRARLHAQLAIAAPVLAASRHVLLRPARRHGAVVRARSQRADHVHLHELVGRSAGPRSDVQVSTKLAGHTTSVRSD